MTASPSPSSTRPWLVALALSLAGIVVWEAAGLDMPVTRLFGDAQGFPLRDNGVMRTLLHDQARAAALALLAVLGWDAFRPLWPGPTRAQRRYWWVVIVLSAVAITALKRVTTTSCPWDLVDFGGTAAYVPHWLLGVRDGGPGHCFPSGHASTAFAFLGLVFLWQPYAPRAARAILWVILAFGVAFAIAQLARGAHHMSHSLWTGWLCAAAAVAARRFAPTPAADVARAGALDKS